MSTLPPSIRQAPSKALVRSVKMATAKAVKVKSAASKTDVNGAPKAKTQMHRRSRSGCYTCRLRRKKCDEGAPFCTACQHLGLECQYKRPLWWSNNDARRRNKEDIKIIIKRKKLAEKASAHALHASVTPPPLPPPPPPSLSHSLPTSISGPDSVAGFYDRNRSASIDSHVSASASASANFNFNSPPTGPVPDFVAYNPSIHPDFAYACSPYEMDVKTERQMFVNNVPTMRESHISTFSTAHTPPPPGTVLPAGSYPNGTWVWPAGAEDEEIDQELLVDEDQIICRRESSQSEEALNVSFFDFSHGPPQESRQVRIELDDNDQRLLEHFIQFVLPTIFPILESNQHGSVSSDLILPALQSNSIYLHCCLSIAAQHMKAIGATDGGDIDGDIMRHRYATIWSLCEALKCDENHEQILEATLGLIFYQCIVGRPDDGLLDIAWHQHFQAAISLVQKLDLPRIVSEEAGPTAQTPFNMTLTAWIDILGASMLGQSPAFAHTYREKHLSQNHQLGLRELMGCEDRVMYLISEIACLESLKRAGMDDFILCQHVSSLGEQISMTEVGDWTPRLPFNANGSLSPKQLCRNITSAFRIAARIYLCSLVPGFSPSQPSPMTLVDKLTAVLQCIPAGTHSDVGYDRSLVWVYLIGGSISGPDSPFRTLVEERVAGLGEQAKCGSFGRMVSVLRETWSQNDLLAQATTPGSTCSDGMPRHVHWREVMQMNGWDYLLL